MKRLLVEAQREKRERWFEVDARGLRQYETGN